MKVIQQGMAGFLIFCCTCCYAQITWDGGAGTANWADADNWSSNSVPGPGDAVLLDNSAVAVSYVVNLPPGNSSTEVLSLTISPALANTITLNIPVSNTASPGLLVTGSGNAVVLNSGAVLKNSSGAAAGSTPFSISSGIFRINNGGKYIHNTPRAHSNLADVLSAAAGTENGTFEFDVPAEAGSYSISASGRTYGNLVLSGSANGGSRSYSSGGSSTLTVNGSLSLVSGATYNFGITNNIMVHGSVTVDPSSELIISTAASNNPTVLSVGGNLSVDGTLTEEATSANPKILFSGASNQNISTGSGGIISGEIIFEINNAAGITLLSDFAIPYQFIFTSGYVNSSSNHTILFNDNATHSGASPSSHVNGPVLKAGDEAFDFPVGDNGHYARLSLTNVNGSQQVTDTFLVEYFRNNPQAVYGNAVETPDINHVSFVEYWEVNKVSGNASKFITLTVGDLSFATDATKLRVARYDGGAGMWLNNGQTFASGPFNDPYIGEITGTSTSQFGPITLASTEPAPVNPLPVKFITTDAQRSGNDVLISWTVSLPPQPGTEFMIEYSSDGKKFTTIGKKTADTGFAYHFVDKNPSRGILYYRIKAKESNGKTAISTVVAIPNRISAVYLTRINPNPVPDKAHLCLFSSVRTEAFLTIRDMTGKIMRQIKVLVSEGSTSIVIDTPALPPGMYSVSGHAAGQPINSIRFVKSN